VKAGHGAQWAAKCTGLAAALWLLAFNASAQQPSSPGQGADVRPQGMGQGSMGSGPHRQQRGRGDGSGPHGMGPGARPAQFAADDPAAPRGGQMSREERRQLRRDVHEAGRDLYPERRRGGRHQQPPPGQTPPEPPAAR
jgi:hypothetical protein